MKAKELKVNEKFKKKNLSMLLQVEDISMSLETGDTYIHSFACMAKQTRVVIKGETEVEILKNK